MKRVCLVIPNWNGWKDTMECLDSIYCMEKKDELNVIVVDNCSTDESVEKLQKWALDRFSPEETLFVKMSDNINITNISFENKQFILVENIENSGFAGAVNCGLKFGLAYGNYEYFWVLNNDTIVDRKALSALLEFVDHSNEEFGVIGTTIMEFDEKETIQCAGGCYYNKILTLNVPYLKGKHLSEIKKNTNKTPRFDYIHGASMFIPTNTLKNVGLFNEDYFLYYEELDFTQRISKYNFMLGWCADSIIYHKGGSSAGSKSLSNQKKSILSEYYSNLSALKYTIRFHKFIFPIVFVLRFILKSALLIKNREWKLFIPLFNSYFDFCLNRK
ncbi:glycosyltransferase family 2 protein [Bacillus smithii]|uniref:glycosyltransferase family 2 protein n=1 Tax=Bacillus smithii TaxID=1479 RepID=UPI0030CA102C